MQTSPIMKVSCPVPCGLHSASALVKRVPLALPQLTEVSSVRADALPAPTPRPSGDHMPARASTRCHRTAAWDFHSKLRKPEVFYFDSKDEIPEHYRSQDRY